jgi:23S rRNA (uracil1939-C5)-methyltransferase
MNKHEKAGKTFEVTIEKLVHEGMGLGRHLGRVVFVPFSVPGDHLSVRPVEVKKTFARAEIIQIIKPGKGRVTPACPHFQKCGGCQLQHLEYPRQVETKRQILEEILHHRLPETRELTIAMSACPQPYSYRSRARMQVRGCGPKTAVGFFRCRSHAVEDIESCPLFRPSLNEALSSLRQYKLKVDTDASPQEMDLACSEEEDAWATECIGEGSNEGMIPLLGTRRKGQVILRRKAGEFTYSVTASVFFQANDFMVSELAALAMELAESKGNNAALDLYAGVGLFSLPLAHQFAKVIAVENSEPSARLCMANASSAGIHNIQAACADVSTWLKSEGAQSSPKFDLVVLDPPRTGAGAEVMEQIRKLDPETIIYVSCDPQTLTRDIAQISPHRYKIDFVHGLDMFPQTYHFETIVRLIKQ